MWDRTPVLRGCLTDCATKLVPDRTDTQKAHRSKKSSEFKTGFVVLVCSGHWDLDQFEMIFFFFFWSVFYLREGHCVYGLYTIILILILVVYDYYLLLLLLLKIGTSRFVCPLMPSQKKINYCYWYYSKGFRVLKLFLFIPLHYPYTWNSLSVEDKVFFFSFLAFWIDILVKYYQS